MKRSHVQTDTPAVQQKDALRPAEPEGIVLSSELIEAFLSSLLEKGRTPDTVQSYRKNLEQFYNKNNGMLYIIDRALTGNKVMRCRSHLSRCGG